MRHRRAAVLYAKALFALAKERNQTELVGRELGDLAATLESDRDLRDFFARPWTPATVKRTVATEVAQKSGLSKLTSDFAALVAGRGRTDHIEVIAEKPRTRARTCPHRGAPHGRGAPDAVHQDRTRAPEPAGSARGGRRPHDARRPRRGERRRRVRWQPRGPARADAPASCEWLASSSAWRDRSRHVSRRPDAELLHLGERRSVL